MESPSNTVLLSAGTKCAAAQCGLHDYLPFKCQFCKESFCSSHFRPATHHCEKEVNQDRVAPPCPLCSTPVTIPIGEDPNIAMERHFDNACEVMGRKRNAAPRCARHKCKNVLITPIRCESCKELFCPTHRHPSTHRCTPTISPGKSDTRDNSKVEPQTSRSRSNAGASSSTSKFSGASLLGRQAPRPATTAQQTPKGPSKPAFTTPAAGVSGGTPSSTIHNPFSKVDRRAKAEMESKRKAMTERARKGLLSEKEKEIFAREEALLAQAQGQNSKDCVVM
ncbi:hypothetical protein BS47DRAFT_1340049 [Hydnum rufescens UP504]|uniref:AN1-type domain-containing protein n=1 Tax=Hydnum rufescens UP504 TaxID=1448309 RepID=A0A9P6B4E9_9AGAM|nr:hypothetical protein BS47DRAFT_1340049 [Hydnum rufescens UP504]